MPPATITDVVESLGTFTADPYAFVLFSFPWNEPGTELEAWEGPLVWQAKTLCDIRDGLLTPNQAIQLATRVDLSRSAHSETR
mgnify:CR=1 FL=1